MPFTGKLIAVTGAASGIGLATARLLAQRGAALSIADINAEGLGKARTLIESENSPKSHILTTALDVRDSAQVDSWIKRSTDKLGPIYGAANVARVTEKQLSGNPLDAAEWDHIIGTNLTGVMHCVRAQARNASSEGASIVNVSKNCSAFGTEGYQGELRGTCGGLYTTYREGIQRLQIPMILMSDMQRLAKPEEVANVIAFLLSQEASFVTGSTYPVDGGYLY
ncbi:SDR family NAD(P)-dependent oxidoreductase [Aspergillus tubingensis]|uniref:SDR family NAD(P)-dependent oxidoreductase n=1 Tax=Aspergillus tubingensis TaxID=5068 RepID=UPI001577B4EF|nr:short chain dehydrogenase [Aspergillus tubingensis]GFN17092.1 short chain dehydrogenase [Aspergillus tubingensis]